MCMKRSDQDGKVVYVCKQEGTLQGPQNRSENSILGPGGGGGGTYRS